LPDGVTVAALGQQLEVGDDWLRPYVAPGHSGALIALNSALAADGAVIRVGRDARLDRPIQLLMLSGETEAAAQHPRHVIVLEEGAAATILETYAGANTEGRGPHGENQVYWTNAVGRFEVGAGATLRHYKRQVEGASAFHLASSEVTLAARASYESFVLSAGARLARNEIEVRLAGDGASCRLDSLGLVKQSQHSDTTTRINHECLGGSSSQLAKNVVADKARAVFQGRIRVAPGAQKSDARQLNRNLLLSKGACADTKPELEILADDVKCSHGATVGDLEPDGLFCLRSRGLDEEAARTLLVEGFAGEALENITDATIRAHLMGDLRRWLAGLRV
jgi:Fe-S cluster assembly protein SufD